jgi:hypothetical protein
MNGRSEEPCCRWTSYFKSQMQTMQAMLLIATEGGLGQDGEAVQTFRSCVGT